MKSDVIIIGAGAAGLMCAIQAGTRERNVLLIEHCNKVGKKILISGGGRCNFTNMFTNPTNFSSLNEHFCKSALARFTSSDFVKIVEEHGIEYHEKKLGQLFCNGSAREIVKMLLSMCEKVGVSIELNCTVKSINNNGAYEVHTNKGDFSSDSLVIATGGLSIPKMGATDFGHGIAKQFGLKLTETKPGLVPFTFDKKQLDDLSDLSGISIDAEVSCNGEAFRENILFTHRGISGPAILQISSYWTPGDEVTVNLLPDIDVQELLLSKQDSAREVQTLMSELLPKRFVVRVFERWLKNNPTSKLTEEEIARIASFFNSWTLKPNGTEGYRTAEVTVGGVSVDEISSKTFESNTTPGLYFIGEVLDVTGWLGGYNFQWAWASGFCAGQYV